MYQRIVQGDCRHEGRCVMNTQPANVLSFPTGSDFEEHAHRKALEIISQGNEHMDYERLDGLLEHVEVEWSPWMDSRKGRISEIEIKKIALRIELEKQALWMDMIIEDFQRLRLENRRAVFQELKKLEGGAV